MERERKKIKVEEKENNETAGKEKNSFGFFV